MSDGFKMKLNVLAIIEAIDKIGMYSQEFNDADTFFEDSKSFDACMMQFVVIGEMVSRLDDAFRSLHGDIPWQQIKNFRNLVAHDYFGLSAYDVWEIIQDHLPPLKIKLERLANSL